LLAGLLDGVALAELAPLGTRRSRMVLILAEDGCSLRMVVRLVTLPPLDWLRDRLVVLEPLPGSDLRAAGPITLLSLAAARDLAFELIISKIFCVFTGTFCFCFSDALLLDLAVPPVFSDCCDLDVQRGRPVCEFAFAELTLTDD